MRDIRAFLLNFFVNKVYSLLPDKREASFALMFHKIDKEISNEREYQTSLTDFITMIEFYCERYVPISLEEFRDKRAQKDYIGNYLVTFDDGHKGVYEFAYPYLKEKKIPFAVFITIDYIGSDGYMTWEEIEELKNSGLCIIGSHSLTHPKLRYSVDSKDEIKLSKEELEKKLCIPIHFFAYPFGTGYACSIRNIIDVKKAGYCLAFSTVPARFNLLSCASRYFIPRICAEKIMNKRR